MATAGKSQVAREDQPTPTETKGTEALVGTAGVGVTELETPTSTTDSGREAEDSKRTDKAGKDAQETVDRYTNNKTAKANKELGRVGEDKEAK